MEDCQTSQKINDNPFSCLTIPEVTDVKVTMDENVVVQKECEHRPDSNDVVLTDNFMDDLLSRDAEEKVLVSVENKELFNNASVSKGVISGDKLEIVTNEDNSRTTLETSTQKSVEGTVPPDCVHTKVSNALQKNTTVEKEIGNTIISDSTCVSSNLEQETEVHKTVNENMELSADIMERSCIEKVMEDCQTSQKINDNPFSCLTIPEVTDVKIAMDENVVAQKECELKPDSNDFLTDNFLFDLLSSNAGEKVLVSVENKEQSNNASISKGVISGDKLEIITDENNSRTTLETSTQKSVEGTVPLDCVLTKVSNASQKNTTVENELGNTIICDSTCISSNLEQETEVHKTVNEDMELSADIVERSHIEKDVKEIDGDMSKPETANLTDSLKKSQDETVKEVSIQETPNSNIWKEQSSEGMSTFNQSKYRCESDIWTDDEDDSSTSDSSSSDSDFFQEMSERSKPKKMPFVKTKGELSLDDLPPIEDLAISVNESEMTAIGKVYTVVEKLVIIHSMKGMKALDLDSVLFLSHDQPLGRVFDVFGPVTEPFYSVRFNSEEQINEKGVKVGAEVFFAPEKSDITTYVFLEELQNQKGSDASWKHNNEPPEEFLDFSDDEQEKNAKRQRRFRNRNRQFSDNPDAPAKRPLLSEDSSNYIPPPKPAPQWNRSQSTPYRMSRPNPFQSRISSPSPSPSVHGFASPVRVQNYFGSHQNQPQRLVQPQNIMYRPSPQIFASPYQQPHVFGQLTVLNHLSPAFHAPPPMPSPVMSNVPTLVPASHFSTPQNYFNQSFARSPSPVIHNHHMSSDPWLSNRPYNSTNVPPSHPLSPYNSTNVPPSHPLTPYNSTNVPPSHPLTVQIPNMSSPSPTFPMHRFPGERAPAQQFVNIQNGNYEPFMNNRNFPPVNMQPRFYHS